MMTDLFVELGKILCALPARLQHDSHAIFERGVFHLDLDVPRRRAVRGYQRGVDRVVKKDRIWRCQKSVYDFGEFLERYRVCIEYLQSWSNSDEKRRVVLHHVRV